MHKLVPIPDTEGAGDIDVAPTVHRVQSLALELLDSNSRPLRERILQAGERADEVRVSLQRTAEGRIARVKGGGEAVIRLFAWPLLVGSQHPKRLHGEPFVMTHEAELHKRIASAWSEALAGSGATTVFPLNFAVHLHEVLGVPPNQVHECVFRGACYLEGHKAQPYRFAPKPGEHPVHGPLAGMYLMPAYVVSPLDKPVPRAVASQALLNRAAALLHASIVPDNVPMHFKLLQPRTFYNAIEVAQREQLAHFAEWCERRNAAWDLHIGDASDNDERKIVITASYMLPHEGTTTHQFTFDGVWRTDHARQQLRHAVATRGRAAKQAARGDALERVMRGITLH